LIFVFVFRFFEFRVCGQPDAPQACLDANVLQILSGQPSDPQPGDLSTRFYPRFGSGITYEVMGVLPAGKEVLCTLR
jgi:hypothetical protein